MPISKELQAKVDALIEMARKNGKPAPKEMGPTETSLSRVIRNQKEADEFMQRLRALG